MDRSRRAAALAAGVGAGFVSGLLGVGGGIVMVPALVILLGFPQHRAHGTSLAAILPIAAVGAAGFALHGEIDYALAALLAAGAVVGAPLGVRLMSRVPERPLRGVFVAVALAAGVRLLVS